MAFVNRRLTNEEREEFLERGIKNPLNKTLKFEPISWTIDEDGKSFLIRAGAFRDFPEEKLFIFYVKNNYYLFKLEIKDINDNTKEWNFISYESLLKEVDSNKVELKKLFKEALKIYKYNGLPDNYKQQFNMIINF